MFRVIRASTTASSVPSSSPQHSAGASASACATTRVNAADAMVTFGVLYSLIPYLCPLPSSLCPVRVLYDHGDPHPPTDAQRSDAVASLSCPQRIEERREHARAAGANRMTERDRSAVDVHLRGVEPELSRHG